MGRLTRCRPGGALLAEKPILGPVVRDEIHDCVLGSAINRGYRIKPALLLGGPVGAKAFTYDGCARGGGRGSELEVIHGRSLRHGTMSKSGLARIPPGFATLRPS